MLISNISIAQTSIIDSLKTELQKGQPDTIRIIFLNDLGWEFRYKNPDTSILLGKQALELAERIEHKKSIANTNSTLGVYYDLKGNYIQSLSHHFKALEIRKQLGDRNFIATSIGNIGIVYYAQGKYPKALKHYFEALEIDKELGNKNGIARHHNNIGYIYNIQGYYPKALEHYFEALKIDKELGDKRGIAIRLGNIGIIYNEQGDYHKALKYYFEALEINKELGNKIDMSIDLGNIGYLYTKQAKSLSDTKLQVEKYKEAEQYLKGALVLANSIGYLMLVKEWNQYLSNLYTQTNRYSLALEHYKQYTAVKDSLFNETSSRQIAEMQTKYETEKKEKEIELLNKENEVKDLEITRKTISQYALGGGVFIVGFIRICIV